MEFKGIRVFVPEAGKQALATVRGLKELGCHVTVSCGSKHNACYASKLPDKKIIFKDLFLDIDATYQFYLEQAKSGNYDVLMPIGEKSTSIVNSHEDEFKKLVKVACAPMKAYIQVLTSKTRLTRPLK